MTSVALHLVARPGPGRRGRPGSGDLPAGRRLRRGAELIGNYPQAFSEIGLVNAAWAITQAEQHRQNRVDQAREERREDRAGAL
jgi:hypothetical protein